MALYTYSSIRYPLCSKQARGHAAVCPPFACPYFAYSFVFVRAPNAFEQCLIQGVDDCPPGLRIPLSSFATLPIAYACFLISLAACFRLKLHSSYARPAPKPTPTNAGHALRLNRSTENTTPKPSPRVDLTSRFDRHRSHCTVCISNQFISYAHLQNGVCLPSRSKVPH